MNADSVSFSNQRRAARAQHGEVSYITPTTTSGEDGAAFRRRSQKRQYIEKVQRRSRTKRIGAIAAVVVVLALIGAAVAWFVYQGSVGSSMALKNSDAKDALVAAKADEPQYTLIAAKLGSAVAPLETDGPDALILARIDSKAKTIALINVPAGLRTVFNDGKNHRIADAATSGDAALIKAVSNFVGVDISHYVKLDKAGFVGLVDALGGIDTNVEQDIDDPNAGDLYIEAGEKKLSGAEALVYLRATNLQLGVSDQLEHQVYFAGLLLEKIFKGQGGLGFAARLDTIGSFIQTDYSVGDISALADWLTDKSASDIQRIVIPGYVTSESGVVSLEEPYFYVADASDVTEIITALDEGKEPDALIKDDLPTVEPSSFKLKVQNGTDISGAAKSAGDLLASKGFNIVDVGNADQSVYTETLVVYRDENAGPAQAQTVIEALGAGRAVEGGSYYTFDEGVDVMLILGSDYKPIV